MKEPLGSTEERAPQASLRLRWESTCSKTSLEKISRHPTMQDIPTGSACISIVSDVIGLRISRQRMYTSRRGFHYLISVQTPFHSAKHVARRALVHALAWCPGTYRAIVRIPCYSLSPRAQAEQRRILVLTSAPASNPCRSLFTKNWQTIPARCKLNMEVSWSHLFHNHALDYLQAFRVMG